MSIFSRKLRLTFTANSVITLSYNVGKTDLRQSKVAVNRRTLLLTGGAAVVAGCNTAKPVISTSNYTGPSVTRVVVMKSNRRMYLLNGQEVLRKYRVDLGFAPRGDKKVQGDGKTPEGRYFIDRRNPNSSYYLSLGIS